MGHAILLGDSIFDNATYVPDGTAVIDHLRMRMPHEWQVSLLACDGAITAGVLKQLDNVPTGATHLLLSTGGNDALLSSSVLNSPTTDSDAILTELVFIQNQFQSDYQELLRALSETRLPTIACTIYDSVPGLQPAERMGLSLFNDMIVRELVAAHISILDLRYVCNEAKDYSEVSPIEPSDVGGSKIARAIEHVLLSHDFSRSESVVYP